MFRTDKLIFCIIYRTLYCFYHSAWLRHLGDMKLGTIFLGRKKRKWPNFAYIKHSNLSPTVIITAQDRHSEYSTLACAMLVNLLGNMIPCHIKNIFLLFYMQQLKIFINKHFMFPISVYRCYKQIWISTLHEFVYKMSFCTCVDDFPEVKVLKLQYKVSCVVLSRCGSSYLSNV